MKQIVRTPDFTKAKWLNHEKLSLDDFKGKIVLLDFWTFCCINCIQVLPDLEKLEKEFEKELVVVGIHCAKFTAEKKDENIIDAINRYNINHIVLNDKEFDIWSEFGIRAWPSLILIDQHGYVVSGYSGEGNYKYIRDDILKLISLGDINKDKIFTPTLNKNSSILRYPGKISTSKDFLAISNSSKNELLITTKEGEVVVKITDLNDPQGGRFYNDSFYLCNTKSGEVLRFFDDFSKHEVVVSNLHSPWDLEIKDDILYIAVAGTHQIYKYNLFTKSVEVFAGNRHEGLKNGYRLDSHLAQPSGLSFLGDILYFIDSETSSLRHIEDDFVKTDIGLDLFDFGDIDGDKKVARLQHPIGVTTGKMDGTCGGFRIFVADSYNNKIKVFDLSNGEIKTIIQNLNHPAGIAKYECMLYIANTNAHEIVLFDLKNLKQSLLDIKESLDLKTYSIKNLS
ncbi:MAG: redoxin domain-containing protein [Campylobacterales bacterium]|nr:redoxin domain-containing protein [Campylobacterales bacterium]